MPAQTAILCLAVWGSWFSFDNTLFSFSYFLDGLNLIPLNNSAEAGHEGAAALQMQLNDAIRAHVQWLIALVDMLDEDRKDLLDSRRIARHDLCRLGQWLNELEPDFGSLPEFQVVARIHAEFHRQAAQIVENCWQTGDQEALHRLESLSGKDGLSDDLIQAVAELIDRLNALGVEGRRIYRPLLPDPELVAGFAR